MAAIGRALGYQAPASGGPEWSMRPVNTPFELQH